MINRLFVYTVVQYLLLFQIKEIYCKCDKVQASISQKDLKEGFHREITYVIKFSEQRGLDLWSHGACRLCLEQKLPSGAYVNSDELQDLARFDKVHAYPVGEVDVEKPQHMSRPIIVHMYEVVNSSRTVTTLPIHLRYHKAKVKGGFETVEIGPPLLLLRCPNNVFKMCNNVDTVRAPCAANSQQKCSWHNISTKVLTPTLMMNVPVGNLDDFTYVALVTFLVCFAGCFYIIFVLSRINLTSVKSITILSHSHKKKRN